MLILAMHNWKEAITIHLWGFAMVYASQICNSTLREGELQTSLQKFAQVTESPNVNFFHTFGRPVYNLDPKLQIGGSLESKWSERARIGIFLGLSREHASSVSVVLNPDTGLTSPQFHVKHDERFKTVGIAAMKDIGRWQEKTHIHEREPRKKEPNKRRKLNPNASTPIPVTTKDVEADTATKKRGIEAVGADQTAPKRRKTKTTPQASQREQPATQAQLPQREDIAQARTSSRLRGKLKCRM